MSAVQHYSIIKKKKTNNNTIYNKTEKKTIICNACSVHTDLCVVCYSHYKIHNKNKQRMRIYARAQRCQQSLNLWIFTDAHQRYVALLQIRYLSRIR